MRSGSGRMRAQMVAFVVITSAGFGTAAFKYMGMGGELGIGTRDVTVELAATGGLYPKARVTYRGTDIGQVRSVNLDPDGVVRARLRIDDDAQVPADSIAKVRSLSVVGEQYVDFVPPEESSDVQTLADGAVIPVEQTLLPVTTNEVLSSVNGLLDSVPQDDLHSLITETGEAFRGTGGPLTDLIRDGSSFQDAATEALPETRALIGDAGVVLATQRDLAPELSSFSTSLDELSGELAAHDRQINDLLREGTPFFDQVSAFSSELRRSLTPVLKDTALISQPLAAYLPAIEHLLIELPAMEIQLQAAIHPDQRAKKDPRLSLFLKTTFDPPPCTHGFTEAGHERMPDATEIVPVDRNSYCKVAPDSPVAVRGARNSLCPNDPTRRGARASECGLVFLKNPKYDDLPPGVSGGSSSRSPVEAGLFPKGGSFLTARTSTARDLVDLLTVRKGR